MTRRIQRNRHLLAELNPSGCLFSRRCIFLSPGVQSSYLRAIKSGPERVPPGLHTPPPRRINDGKFGWREGTREVTKYPTEHRIPLTLSGAKLEKKRKMCHASIMGQVERGVGGGGEGGVVSE